MALVTVYADWVEELEDLGTCAYYQRTYMEAFPDADPDGQCSFGCSEEPACLTSEPYHGWPNAREAFAALRKQVAVQIR